MMARSETLAAALDLARIGWKIFAVDAEKKPFPRTHGCKDATNDPGEIRKMWGKHPGAAIAVATGAASGIWVLDLDVKGGVDGVAELAKLEAQHGALPPTLMQRTPSGGQHRFFKTNGATIRNSASAIAPGVDVRGDGGYVVVAPSRVKAGAYDWVTDDPAALPSFEIAEAPRHVALVAAKKTKRAAARGTKFVGADHPYIRATVENVLGELRSAREGGRNHALNVAAVQLGHWTPHVLGRAEVEGWLRHEGIALGLEEREIAATIASGIQAGMREPREVPEGRRPVARAIGQPAEPRSDDAQGDDTAGARLVLNPRAPLRIAQTFAARFYEQDGAPTLFHHAGVFAAWTGTCYAPAEDAAMRAQLYAFLDRAERPIGKGLTAPFHPSGNKVSEVLDALAASTNLPAHIRAPTWIDGAEGHPPAAEIIACSNGLLHVPTRRLLPHSPAFFGESAVSFDYQPRVVEPKHWLAFLASIWPDDIAAIETLQEAIGYLLTADTAQQKLFLIAGPKRSGKGTIGRVVRRLVGEANVVSPTLGSLGTQFGPQALIGKQLALISDARLGGRTDAQAVAERLLSISGEDAQTIDRKFLPAWSGALPTRFLILTNELPRFTDASGALASRFIALTMLRSFYGAEDHGLTARLLTELPAIFGWSLVGLDRLTARGYFVQPPSSADAVRAMEDLAAPIGAFVRERCIVEPGASVPRFQLYSAWCDWSREQGNDKPGTTETFGRDLRAHVPGIGDRQPRENGVKIRIYAGIGLRRSGGFED